MTGNKTAARYAARGCPPVRDDVEHIQRPSRGLLALLEQTAVVWPCCGRPGPGEDPDSWMHDALQDLAARNRIAARRATSPDHPQYERRLSCRPGFGLWHNAEARPHCGLARLCSHCWSRRAANHWRTVDNTLFPRDARGRRPKQADVDLILAVRTVRKRGWRPYRSADGTIDLERALADRCGNRKGPAGSIPGRGYEFTRLPALGVLDITVLKPTWRVLRDGTRGHTWELQLRQLIAVRPGQQLQIPGAKLRPIERPTPKELAAAVGRTCRYPESLLPATTEDYLNVGPHDYLLPAYLAATEGRKLVAATGVFATQPSTGTRVGGYCAADIA